jgi:hypothetical protein
MPDFLINDGMVAVFLDSHGSCREAVDNPQRSWYFNLKHTVSNHVIPNNFRGKLVEESLVKRQVKRHIDLASQSHGKPSPEDSFALASWHLSRAMLSSHGFRRTGMSTSRETGSFSPPNMGHNVGHD